MDLEAIERALEKCLAAEDARHEVDDHDGLVVTRARWVDAAEDVAMHHGLDLLRLVRAMRWVEENRGAVWYSTYGCFACDWNVDTKTEGATPLAAIEAAMTSNQPRAT